MTAKHTPGPWESRKVTDVYGYQGWHITGSNAVYRVAVIQDVSESPANAANARLIKSAPELLEALQALADAFHQGRATYAQEQSSGYVQSLVDAAEAAIAKATGKAA